MCIKIFKRRITLYLLISFTSLLTDHYMIGLKEKRKKIKYQFKEKVKKKKIL